MANKAVGTEAQRAASTRVLANGELGFADGNVYAGDGTTQGRNLSRFARLFDLLSYALWDRWSITDVTPTTVAATTLSASTTVGATSISVATSIPAGTRVQIGTGVTAAETVVTTAVSGSGPYTVTVPALTLAHTTADPVVPVTVIDVMTGKAFAVSTTGTNTLLAFTNWLSSSSWVQERDLHVNTTGGGSVGLAAGIRSEKGAVISIAPVRRAQLVVRARGGSAPVPTVYQASSDEYAA